MKNTSLIQLPWYRFTPLYPALLYQQIKGGSDFIHDLFIIQRYRIKVLLRERETRTWCVLITSIWTSSHSDKRNCDAGNLVQVEIEPWFIAVDQLSDAGKFVSNGRWGSSIRLTPFIDSCNHNSHVFHVSDIIWYIKIEKFPHHSYSYHFISQKSIKAFPLSYTWRTLLRTWDSIAKSYI